MQAVYEVCIGDPESNFSFELAEKSFLIALEEEQVITFKNTLNGLLQAAKEGDLFLIRKAQIY